MKITQIEPLPSINKFKNKEDFCNTLIQKILMLSKENKLFLKTNTRITELNNKKNNLLKKGEKLNGLLEKSKVMKNDLSNKINTLTEENNLYKNKLIELLLGSEQK